MCRLKRQNFSRHNVAVTLVTRSAASTFVERVTTGKYRSKDGIKSNFDKMKFKDYSLDTATYTGHRNLANVDEALATNETEHRSTENVNDEERGREYHKNDSQSVSLSSYESKDRGTGFELHDSFPTKAVVRLESKLSNDENSETTKSGRCRARRVLRKVTLRSGLKSGDFSDFGQVPNINACVRHCCEQQACDVSLLLNKHCYTLHCYKPELCKIMPSHDDSKLEPQLAFVTRSTNEVESNTRVKKKASSSNGGTCPHGAIFSDVSLKGGHKAGKFELLSGAKDMRSCIQKCCASASCQVAWLLGDHCYSVACYDKCITVKKHSSSIRSQLTLLTRNSQKPENNSKLLTEVVAVLSSCCFCLVVVVVHYVDNALSVRPFLFLVHSPFFTRESSTATVALLGAVSLSHPSLPCSVFIFTERQGIPGSREDHGKFKINSYVTISTN